MLSEPVNQIVAATPDEYVVRKLMRHINGNSYTVVDSQRRGRIVRFDQEGNSTCTCQRSACDHRRAALRFDELYPSYFGDRIHVISLAEAMSEKLPLAPAMQPEGIPVNGCVAFVS